MAEKPDQQSEAKGEEARPLDEAELDRVAGGKRSNVQDAHDKYANSDTSYDKG